jgi:hypothetical protein
VLPRRWRGRPLRIVLTVAAALVIVPVAIAARRLPDPFSDGPTSVPACAWPLHVHGPATRAQAGLVRCYLQALARHDTAGLQAVAEQPTRITGAQFFRTPDARAGTATATIVPNQVDSAYFTVRIVFADGTFSSVPMVLANPETWHSWRLQIGVLGS